MSRISQVFCFAVEWLKAHWKSMRDRYNKIQKELHTAPSGSGRKSKKTEADVRWPLYAYLRFLDSDHTLWHP